MLPQPAQPGAPAPHTPGAPDTAALHDVAITAEKALEQLATGLGQIGAAPQAVKAISQMADVLRKITVGLAHGMKNEPAPTQPHTMTTATDAMMAAHNGPPAGP